jgi:hypothetical protein
MVETQQQWLMFGAMVIPIMELSGLSCATTENQSLHDDGKPERAPFHDQIVLLLYHMQNDFVNDLFSFLDR